MLGPGQQLPPRLFYSGFNLQDRLAVAACQTLQARAQLFKMAHYRRRNPGQLDNRYSTEYSIL
jgi:hypothetical protein